MGGLLYKQGKEAGKTSSQPREKGELAIQNSTMRKNSSFHVAKYTFHDVECTFRICEIYISRRETKN